MPVLVCQKCRKKLRPPDHLAGRRVTCPRCEAVLMVPLESESSPEIPTNLPEPESVPEDPPLPPSVRIGVASLLLGCISILSLCLPFVGYIAIVLSIIGLPVGAWGMYRVLMEGNHPILRSAGGTTGIVGNFGTRTLHYPLAGLLACFLAFILALLPIVLN
jgi:hypothetical protein